MSFLLVLLCTACSADAGVNWADEGAGLGRGLEAEGRERNEANCQRAVKNYSRDVGLPTGDDLAVMRDGCERG